MAYHHALACISSAFYEHISQKASISSAAGCIRFRNDDIQGIRLDDIHAFGVMWTHNLIPRPLQIPDLHLFFGRKCAIIYEIRVCLLASKRERLYFETCAKISGFQSGAVRQHMLISIVAKLIAHRL